jgi:hypothetical protein
LAFRLQRARAAICAIWRRRAAGRAAARARPSLQAAAPSEGGGMDADAERTAPLGERHAPHAARGRVAPGTVRVRIRGLDPLALPLADAAAAGHELTASVGNHSCPS